MQIIRDLYYLARETVGVFRQGFEVGMRIARNEGLDRDEITHGPAWSSIVDESPLFTDNGDGTITWRGPVYFSTSSTDGEIAEGVTRADPPVDERPEAVSDIRPSAASGHPNEWTRGVIRDVAAFGLRQWIAGEKCDAPTYFASIARDLEQLSK
jgi:hypothetical protein